MRPLWFDTLQFLLPLVIAALAFVGAAQLRRLLPTARGLVLGGAVMGVGGLVAWGELAPTVGAPLVARLGGITIVLCLLTTMLLGAAWSEPNRRTTSRFLITLGLLAGVVIALHASGPLFWRTIGWNAWNRFPNDGVVAQSFGFSCAPAAAAMLLGMHGVVVSEGQLAYLARTSPLGTDVEMLARAMGRVLPDTLRVEVVRDWEALRLDELEPFVAYVGGRFAGHAIVVRPLVDGTVLILDPDRGRRSNIPAERFREQWDRIAVRVVPAA